MSAAYRDMMFLRVFTGKLQSYGRYYCKFEHEFMDQITYGFFALSKTSHTTLNTTVEGIRLFQSCQMTVDTKKQISVLKAWILFVNVFDEQQRSRIPANITAFIETAEMQDFSFDDFGGRGIKSCEILSSILMKCKTDFTDFAVDQLIVTVLMLLIVTIIVLKVYQCILELRSNKVEDIREH